jgi:preprotein translocase subunit SecG
MERETSYIKWGLALAAGVGLIALGWKFFWVLVTLHVLLCIVLILVVLLQSGKAADLAGAFGGAGSQTAFGPRGAATFLSKATTWCFIMFILSTLSITMLESQGLGSALGSGSKSVLERTQKPPEEKPAAPSTTPPGESTPAAPASTPQQTPPQSSAPAPAQPAPAPARQNPPAKPPAKQ